MQDEKLGEIYLYDLLRRVFLNEPTPELLNEIMGFPLPHEGDLAAQGMTLLINAVQCNASRLETWIEELAIEYARLFIGPIKPLAVPYASFYLSETRQLMTDETICVRGKYLEAGIALKELYSVPDDHIGIELEFLYHLAHEILSLEQKDNHSEASALEEIKTDFFANHVAQWVPEFTEHIVSSTQEDFYKGAALLLKGAFVN